MAIDTLLLIDPPASGVWNMSLDEALLDAVAAGMGPVLRFYRWSEPTLTLGYFQQAADRELFAASAKLPATRRSSGGGALVHDHELTYSLALPADYPGASDPVTLTCQAHHAARDALVKLGVAPDQLTLCEPPPAVSKKEEPFHCFDRRAHGDLLIGDSQGTLHKIAGSAQRKKRGGVLQHGGLLLAQSGGAPQLPGIREVAECELEIEPLIDLWCTNLAQRLDLSPTQGGLPPKLREQAERIAQEKYSNQEWVKRR